jgi:hypothetical protein
MAEIFYFAAVLGISLEAAAALLGYRHAVQGGRIPKGESILVGERGPEIFIPTAPGMLTVSWGPLLRAVSVCDLLVAADEMIE